MAVVWSVCVDVESVVADEPDYAACNADTDAVVVEPGVPTEQFS